MERLLWVTSTKPRWDKLTFCLVPWFWLSPVSRYCRDGDGMEGTSTMCAAVLVSDSQRSADTQKALMLLKISTAQHQHRSCRCFTPLTWESEGENSHNRGRYPALAFLQKGFQLQGPRPHRHLQKINKKKSNSMLLTEGQAGVQKLASCGKVIDAAVGLTTATATKQIAKYNTDAEEEN